MYIPFTPLEINRRMRHKATMPSTSGCPNARGKEVRSKQVGPINGAIVMTSAFLERERDYSRRTHAIKLITDLLNFFGYL